MNNTYIYHTNTIKLNYTPLEMMYKSLNSKIFNSLKILDSKEVYQEYIETEYKKYIETEKRINILLIIKYI